MRYAVAILLLAAPAWATPCSGNRNLLTGTPAPCDGVLVGADSVAKIGRLRLALDECQRQVAAPLPQTCTPVFVEVPVAAQPVRVTVERTSWTAALFVGVVGLLVGIVGGRYARR